MRTRDKLAVPQTAQKPAFSLSSPTYSGGLCQARRRSRHVNDGWRHWRYKNGWEGRRDLVGMGCLRWDPHLITGIPKKIEFFSLGTQFPWAQASGVWLAPPTRRRLGRRPPCFATVSSGLPSVEEEVAEKDVEKRGGKTGEKARCSVHDGQAPHRDLDLWVPLGVRGDGNVVLTRK